MACFDMKYKDIFKELTIIDKYLNYDDMWFDDKWNLNEEIECWLKISIRVFNGNDVLWSVNVWL